MAEQPSPLTPEINTLLAQAEHDFVRAGAKLFDAVMNLIRGGAALPLNEDIRRRLERLYQVHAAELSARFTGQAFDLSALEEAIRLKRVDPAFAKLNGPSSLTLLFRVGKAYETAKAPRNRGQSVDLKEALKVANSAPLSSRDMETLAYVQTRAASYMRRPMAVQQAAVDRVLNEAEYAKVRGAVALGVREGFSTERLARELRDATQGTDLLNDMRRVARTEGMNAVHAGALVSLKEAAARMRQPDPQVYKIVSPGACDQCKRIWGPMGKPRLYRLSEIEGNNNFQKPAREWVAVIGPVHPACLCPPLMIWLPHMQDTIKKMTDQIMEAYEK